MISAALTITALVAAEVGLRLMRRRSLTIPPPIYTSDSLLGYVLNRDLKLFRESFLGAGVPASRNNLIVIVCLGASTTFGHGVSWAQAWPAVLRDSLGARGIRAAVVNAGVSGYGSRQLLLRYRHQIAALRPDEVIVYEGWNRTGILTDSTAWEPFGIGNSEYGRALVWLARHSILARQLLRTLYERRQLRWAGWRPDEHQVAWEADMDSLAREIAGHGQHASLVLYPGLYYRGMSPGEATIFATKTWQGRRYDPRQLDEIEAKHRALRDIASREHASLIDAAGDFAGLHGPARSAAFLDEMHLSVSGNARFAGLVARQLAAAAAVPPSAAPPRRERSGSTSTTRSPR